MTRTLIIAISLFWLPTFGQEQSTNDEVHLRATVQAVVPLSSFSGTITPVHFDPRFALTLRVESSVPAVTNFTADAVVTFGIHSPSLLFGGEATKGKTYDFLLRRKINDGKVRFFGLEEVAPPEQLWTWFGNCSEKTYVGLEVVLSSKVIHRSSFPICPISDISKEVGAQQKTVVFSFKGGHVFQGEYHTARTQMIEGNIWQAGADPGLMLLGLSFTSKNQILLNTIHFAKPGRWSTTEIDHGLIVRTFPIHHK